MGNKVDMTNEDRKQAYIPNHVEAENARIKAKETDATNDINPLTGLKWDAYSIKKLNSSLDNPPFTEQATPFMVYQLSLGLMDVAYKHSNNRTNAFTTTMEEVLESKWDAKTLLERLSKAKVSPNSINTASGLDEALNKIQNERVLKSEEKRYMEMSLLYKPSPLYSDFL